MHCKTQWSLKKTLIIGLVLPTVFALDILVMPLDQYLWGKELTASGFFSSPWYVQVVHWALVILGWGTVGISLIHQIYSKDKDSLILEFSSFSKSSKGIVVAIILGIALALGELILFSSSFPQFVHEYNSFVSHHGTMAFLPSLFQNIYYIAESILIVLYIAIMQRVFDVLTKKTTLPWGGITLFFTWGLFHIPKGWDVTIWLAFFCLASGILFTRFSKQWWPVFIIVWLNFFI
ncbi:MAG: hypothetical protein MI717_05000 [Spirochaetales bacterium]|nr:hypothetical protein [Spirochaetales bacterium]